MPQIFHPSMNTLSRVSMFGSLFFVVLAGFILGVVVRSPYVTEAQVVRAQPVPFSHQHHVGNLGFDCRLCHTSVEAGPFAGIPPTKTCMICHSQLFDDSPVLEPIRSSYRTDRPLEWVRVHDLPDFVFFDHSIHVAKGVACRTCHGPVDRMPLMWREHSLYMKWCLDCHRHPELFVEPLETVFDPRPPAPTEPIDGSMKLVRSYDIETQNDKLANCSICHR